MTRPALLRAKDTKALRGLIYVVEIQQHEDKTEVLAAFSSRDAAYEWASAKAGSTPHLRSLIVRDGRENYTLWTWGWLHSSARWGR